MYLRIFCQTSFHYCIVRELLEDPDLGIDPEKIPVEDLAFPYHGQHNFCGNFDKVTFYSQNLCRIGTLNCKRGSTSKRCLPVRENMDAGQYYTVDEENSGDYL
ncbi:hypothetical protein TorRG33x02_187090 [Trema orientale]|uniref:Uncharacterized protein n=1 Tax=Trema orientale TaxID=63057 RepID=A0A2P5EJ31_TREOI|nr:hypothetical protein TorRG33x02_187090 [Trema orientale]